MIVFQWLPESARYDLTRGKPDRAYATIAKIAKENSKPMLLGKLAEPLVKSGSTQVRSTFVFISVKIE